MRPRFVCGVIAILFVNCTPICAQSVEQREPLAEGPSGIAANYAADVGIDRHPSVVFVENFNDDLNAVKSRWESIQAAQNLELSSVAPTAKAGTSLLITHVGGQGTGAHLYRRLQPGFDKLHYRFYVRFDEDCAPIHHFFHVGGYNPPTAWPQGGAGERPKGDERFSTGVEPFGGKWQWDYYTYWMEMRGSPPRGQCWGNSFIRDASVKVKRGQWQCLELMMKVNDVGRANGEMALYLDGQLISHLGAGFPNGKWVYDKFLRNQGGEGVRWSDERNGAEQLVFPPGGAPFEGFRWRSEADLQLNFLWLLCYITKASPGHTSKIWFDQVVVAKEYIGPMRTDK